MYAYSIVCLGFSLILVCTPPSTRTTGELHLKHMHNQVIGTLWVLSARMFDAAGLLRACMQVVVCMGERERENVCVCACVCVT